MSQSQQISSPNPATDIASPEERKSMLLQGLVALVVAIVLGFKYPEMLRAAVAFVITLSILVFVHEWGHYQFARWAGMKVNRFALGFPPFIYTKRKNDIDYSIGALPIGGMVDIAGLGSEEEMVNTATGEVAAPRRDTSRPFGQKQYQDANLFWRFMVIFAGPMMNFIFAIVVAIGLFCFVGVPDTTNATQNRVAQTVGGSPAVKSGVQLGDLVVGINGTPTRDYDTILKAIRSSNGKPVEFTLLRMGEKVNVKITPEPTSVPTLDGTKYEVKPAIGIQFEADPKTVTFNRVGVVEATKTSFIVSLNMTAQVLGLIKRAVTFQLTDIDKSSIGGPVKIAQRAGQAARDGGLRESIMLAIGLSMNLGLMNLLPLPALDGGRIMFLGYELVMRRPFNPRWEGLVHAAGMLMLLSFMLFITLRDVNAGALLERFTH
jgi:regulator of sigma E protease